MTATGLDHVDPWEVAARQFEPKPDYIRDPHLWGQDRLKEHWWSKQREILESIRDNRYTAVQSCHDAGKSFIAARAVAKWIDEHPEGEAFVVTTAPTSAQVSAILWREVLKAHKKAQPRLPGRIVQSRFPEWKIDGGEAVGYGRKPADYDQAAFQGIHARYVLIVIDEACGVDKNLFDAVDALATNEYARVLAIGNPDDPASHFASVCQPDSGWHVITIDGLRTPNFTRDLVLGLRCPDCVKVGSTETLLARLFREEGLPFTDEEVPEDLRPMLLSPLWVEERLHRWVGRATEAQSLVSRASQSSLFTAKVRGLFPESSTEGVIPLGWVERAMQRWRDWDDAGRPEVPGRRVIGVDVARSGEDETVLAPRQGRVTLELRKHHHADTMETTGYVTAALAIPGSIAVVDSIGIGAGVIDRLRELGQSCRAFTGSGSAKGLSDSSGEFGFTNLRSAAWWNLREMLDPSKGSNLAIPDSEMLKADLTAPRWKVLSGGKIQIEPKDDVKKRLGRSPDEGDAIVLSHWLDAEITPLEHGEGHVFSWWDEVDPAEVVSWGVEGMAEEWR